MPPLSSIDTSLFVYASYLRCSMIVFAWPPFDPTSAPSAFASALQQHCQLKKIQAQCIETFWIRHVVPFRLRLSRYNNCQKASASTYSWVCDVWFVSSDSLSEQSQPLHTLYHSSTPIHLYDCSVLDSEIRFASASTMYIFAL